MTYAPPDLPEDTPLVDIQYRCGEIVLGIDPAKRRWTINARDFPINDFDIVRWRPVGETRWRANPLLKDQAA